MKNSGLGTTGCIAALTLALALTACASTPDTNGKPFTVAGFPPGLIEGYLAADAVPMQNGTQAATATQPINLGAPKISDRRHCSRPNRWVA